MKKETIKASRNVVSILLALLSVIALCMVPTMQANAVELDGDNATLVSHEGRNTDKEAVDIYHLSDGAIVKFEYQKDTGEINIYRDGILQKTISDQEIIKKVKDTISSESGVAETYNACGVTLGALGIANGALWMAAGFTAWCPAASAAAGIGGFVTSTVITVGGMFC
ncbi:hypothetical protein [Bifidobacterium vespertilionis]|uniref:hypothetical protein n=1 Tax=Bifidobacterium vespertilionis TaxID=2562524 RepID=UPI001BDD16DD|nr:hypothetical protein [Bifidobacterium vespertilionis]MBT1179045.1 hypothetical protein [Bifidobacterium vespertilionis]